MRFPSYCPTLLLVLKRQKIAAPTTGAAISDLDHLPQLRTLLTLLLALGGGLLCLALALLLALAA